MRQDFFHESVLVDEVIHGLNVSNDKSFIDATVGGGGHAWEIIKRGGKVLGIDQDRQAVQAAKEFLTKKTQREVGKDIGKWKIVQGNFKNLKEIAQREKFGQVDGILFDLGISTYQIKQSGRGFTFGRDEQLDMRMDQELAGPNAYDIINRASKEELYEIITKFGEEQLADKLVHAIVRTRAIKPIETTIALRVVAQDVYKKHKINTKIHPATKVFQALRIAVNQELDSLKTGLLQAIDVLGLKGRLVVISFHSLEDRIVKQTVKHKGLTILTKKPIRPTRKELKQNSSARSAKLRVAQKDLI